jgi:hypothetical protein
MRAIIIPIAARIREKMLTTPPRMLGDMESTKPNIPKSIATNARIKPAAGPTNKLAMAVEMAMIEGILKCALVCPISMN